MAIRGSDAAPNEAPPRQHDVRVSALRWYDLVLLPLGAAGFALVTGLFLVLADWIFLAPEGATPGQWVRSVSSSAWFAYALQIALYAGVVLSGFVLLRWRGCHLSEVYFPRIRFRSVLAAGGLGAIFAGLFMGLLSLLPAETQQELMEQSELLSPTSGGEALALLFLAVLLAPLAEELYFRGVMLRLLSEKVRFVASASLTAILFSLSHGHLFVLPGAGGWALTGLLFTVGFVFAALARFTGSLRAPVVMHGAYNAVLLAPGVLAVFSSQPF